MAWNLMEFNGMYLVRQDIPNKLMIFGSNKKNNRIPPFPKKRSCLKRIKGYNTRENGGGSRHSLST